MPPINAIVLLSVLVANFAPGSARPASPSSIEVIRSLTERQCPTVVSGCPYCTWENNFAFNSWGIYLPDDKAIDATCGGGVLDNFRGVCGEITEWKCDYDNDGAGPGAWMYFNTYAGCQDLGGSLALKRAGSAQNMYQDVICGSEPW